MNATELAKETNTEVNVEKNKPMFKPAASILENDKEAIITLDMPGVNENEIEISVDRDLLIIEGKTVEKHPDNYKAIYTEFNLGNFKRKFKIPKPVDVEKAEAVIKNGRVTLKVPYSAESIKKIKIGKA